MKLFTVAFWVNALEHALVAGAAAFAGSQVFTAGTLTANTWKAAGIAAGVAALYAFVIQVGGVQAVNLTTKVATKARHAASNRATG